MNRSLSEEYCKFVKEILYFIECNFENVIPAGRVDPGIHLWTRDVFKKAEKLQLAGKQDDLEILVENYFKFTIEYFNQNTPWQNVEADRRICCNAILNTIQLVVHLSVLMDMAGYKTAEKVLELFGFESGLQINHIHSGYEISVNDVFKQEN